MENLKISIIILAYNQVNLISRTLDSILRQKEYIYEVLIGDDGSTDGTREILKDYELRYPGIVKPIYNEKNLGIYANKENLINNVTGNLMFSIGGDDEYNDGYFEKITELVNEKQLNCEKEAFVIYCNQRREFADSRPNRVIKCTQVEKDKSPRSLFIRDGVPTHGKGLSRALINKLKPIPKNIGICADTLSCHQDVYLSDHLYSCDYVGAVYHAGIGVSVTEKKIARLESRIKALTILRDKYEWSEKDKAYINYLIKQNEFFIKRKFMTWIKTTSQFIQSLSLSNIPYMKLSLFNYGKFFVRSLMP